MAVSKAEKHTRKKGINRKIFATLIGFTLAILFFVWISAFLLFNSIYGTFVTRKVEKYGRNFVATYMTDGSDQAINSIRAAGDVEVYVFDYNGNGICSYSDSTYIAKLDIDTEKALAYRKVFDYELQNNPNDYNGETCVLSIERGIDSKPIRIVYGERHYIDDVATYFYVATPIVRSATLNEILAVVCGLITVIALLMTTVFAIDLTDQIARPIVSLTATAGRFAKGDRNVVFNADDFLEVEKLTEVLNYSNNELIKLDNFRRELLANVSHDFRTPLTIIKGNAELMLDLTGDDPEKREKQLGIIIKETDRLNLMVEDILNLTKLQSGGMKFNFSSVRISAVISEIINGFESASEKGFEFNLNADDKVCVWADENKLKQVIYNLLGNAVNYSGDSRRIDVNVFEKTGSVVRVEVRDYGVGMTEEEIEGIWLRYYRSSRMSSEVAGSGLGLNIVYSILSGMDAAFGVDSKPNLGSTFWFELKKA